MSHSLSGPRFSTHHPLARGLKKVGGVRLPARMASSSPLPSIPSGAHERELHPHRLPDPDLCTGAGPTRTDQSLPGKPELCRPGDGQQLPDPGPL